MRPVTNKYHKAIKAPGRQIRNKVEFLGAVNPFSGEEVEDGIISIRITENSSNSDGPSLGTFNARECIVKLYNMPTSVYNSEVIAFKVKSGLYVEDDITADEDGYVWVDMGKFYITEKVRKDGSPITTLTAYDGRYKFNELTLDFIYSGLNGHPRWNRVYTKTEQEILQDLTNYSELMIWPTDETSGSSAMNYSYDRLEKYTVAEIIALFAGRQGKNVRINGDNRLEFFWYDIDEKMTYSIGREMQHMNSLDVVNDGKYTLKGIECKARFDDIYTVGDVTGDGVIRYENELMTQEQLNAIWSNHQNFKIWPCEVKYRGNPCLEGSDYLKVVNSADEGKFIIMSEHVLDLTVMVGYIRCSVPSQEAQKSYYSEQVKNSTDKIGALEAKATELKEKLDITQASLEDLSEKVDDIEIGGTNLLRRSNDFTTANFVMTRATGADGVATLTPDSSASLIKSKVNYLDFDDYGEGNYAISYEARYVPNTEEHSAPALRTYLGFSTRFGNSFNASYDKYRTKNSTPLTTEWTKHRHFFAVPEDLTGGTDTALASGAQLSVEFYIGANNYPIQIRNIKLERGNKATDYAPSPYDVWTQVYPIGSIYISYSDTSPATLFGGSWTAIPDVTLGALSVYAWRRTS